MGIHEPHLYQMKESKVVCSKLTIVFVFCDQGIAKINSETGKKLLVFICSTNWTVKFLFEGQNPLLSLHFQRSHKNGAWESSRS